MHPRCCNEDWMTLSNDDITKIMGESGNEEDQVREMIENLSKFMEGESGFEGIGDDGFDEYANPHDLTDNSFQFDSDDELD
jgi:hypothetical protein